MNLVEYLSHKAEQAESYAKSQALSFSYADTQMPHEARMVEQAEADAVRARRIYEAVLRACNTLIAIEDECPDSWARECATKVLALTHAEF